MAAPLKGCRGFEAPKAKGAALDEDDQAEVDQVDREQDVLPALQDTGDGSAGENELRQQHEHRPQG